MKILLIAKAIHPAQSPRSFRVMELAKEFAKNNHEVIIYANIGTYDYLPFENRYNITIKDIGNMVFATHNSDGKLENNYLNKVLSRVIGKYAEFPDIEFFWKISKVLHQEKNTDLLISFAAPHPIHWGVARYRSLRTDNFPTVWIADCGDPYMGNPLTRPPKYFNYFENLFSRYADFITIPIIEALPAYNQKYHDKIKVIPQGFDFKLCESNIAPENGKPIFLYAGNFFPPARDPRTFLKYLSTLNIDFEFIIYTKHKSLIQPFVKELGEKLKIKNFIPRLELLPKMKSVDFLVNFTNNTNLQSPSKLIDYAIAGRPILSINNQKLDTKLIDEFLNGEYHNSYVIDNLEQYHIKNVAEKFLELYYNKIKSNKYL